MKDSYKNGATMFSRPAFGSNVLPIAAHVVLVSDQVECPPVERRRRLVRGCAILTLFRGPAYKGGRDGSSCSFECVLRRSGARCAMKEYDELVARSYEI